MPHPHDTSLGNGWRTLALDGRKGWKIRRRKDDDNDDKESKEEETSLF